MGKSLTVVPAYGRDYKSKAEVMKDWNGDKDFQIADVSCPDNGRYVNKPQVPGHTITVRYAGLRKVMVFKS